MSEAHELDHADFFVFRTPLLPFDTLTGWSEGLGAAAAAGNAEDLDQALTRDRLLLRNRLGELLARPELRDAIFVASSSLESGLGHWFEDPESEKGQKVERAVVRYLCRMAGRSTPFGLFAGCSVGQMGDRTALELAGMAEYGRNTRLDMDYLCSVTEALGQQQQIAEQLKYVPNSSLYRAAGRLRYVETRMKKQVRSHHLVAVEITSYLERTLQRAESGALPGDLAQGLVDDDPEVGLQEAEGYVGQLISSQLLVSDLAPTVTGPEPIHGLVDQLRALPGGQAPGAQLDAARERIARIDADGLGAPPEAYRDVGALLEPLPVKVEISRLFQVDMAKPATHAVLGPEPVAELARGVSILQGLLGGAPHDTLSRFRQAFNTRYEEREVPMTEVLDEEVGIGFHRSGAPTAEASPLLEGLIFGGAPADQSVSWGPARDHLLRRLTETLVGGQQVLELSEDDMQRMTRWPPVRLCGSFSVMGTLVAASSSAIDAGQFQLLFSGAMGPSGANLLGRFCHADPLLEQQVLQLAAREEAQEPDVVYAEVVHLPEGRIGNILARPVLRQYEIPFLGRSGAPPEQCIPVDDLLVSLQAGRVVLRSRRLGKEIRPRLTSAHNIVHPRNVGVYKFLCMMQEQPAGLGLAWSWGPLDGQPFLPRVTSGRLVFAVACWNVLASELQPVRDARGGERFAALHAWRTERGLPRRVLLADGDNQLPVDLENVLSVETLLATVKKRGAFKLKEQFPAEDQLCAEGPEGRFVHELVVPFFSKPTDQRSRVPVDASARELAPIPLRLAPGSNWLYAKFYTGSATVDQLLSEQILPLVRDAMAEGQCREWFFIRYGDPDFHLRVRLRGEPQALLHLQQQLFAAMDEPLADGRLWRVQLDTYEREIRRYGGPVGMTLSEKIFWADSEAIAEILTMLEGDTGLDARWRLTLLGMARLLDDLGLDAETQLATLERIRGAFGEEFQAKQIGLDHMLGKRFRQERKALEELFDPGALAAGHPLGPGIEVLDHRSVVLAPIAAKLAEAASAGQLTTTLPDLAGSYLHMHANRFLRSAARAQELVLYDFLLRLKRSQAARQRKKSK